MGESIVSASGVRYQVRAADKIHDDEWEQIQDLLLFEFSQALDLPEEELHKMLHIGNQPRFTAGRVNPAIDVKEKRIKPQSVTQPIAVTAYEGKVVVGYMYSGYTISGRLMERTVKKLLPGVDKRYHWIREVAVDRAYRKAGIAPVMASLLLQERDETVPTSAYVYTRTGLVDKLISSKLGFEKTYEPRPPDPTDNPFQVQRLEAPSGLLLRNLVQDPRVERALETAEIQRNLD